MTPGVSILFCISVCREPASGSSDLRLTLEIFHNVQEFIIHIRLVVKLNLDLVQVAEGILKGG